MNSDDSYLLYYITSYCHLFEKNYCIIREVLLLLPFLPFFPEENRFIPRGPAILFRKTIHRFRLFHTPPFTFCLFRTRITQSISDNRIYIAVSDHSIQYLASFHIIPSFLRSTHNSKPTLSWIKHYHLRIHFNISRPQ